MVLVDTSSWIHSLRPDGDEAVTERVRALLMAGEAAWCAMVRLELWSGARGDHERRVLADMETHLPDLNITTDVWRSACLLAKKARKAGKTIPATDLLIAACARFHHVSVEHVDKHFEMLEELV